MYGLKKNETAQSGQEQIESRILKNMNVDLIKIIFNHSL